MPLWIVVIRPGVINRWRSANSYSPRETAINQSVLDESDLSMARAHGERLSAFGV
jgi:hypothetical protein